MTPTTNIRALRYVSYADIPQYLDMGWITKQPAIFDRMSYYGVTMAWTCDCTIPDKRRT